MSFMGSNTPLIGEYIMDIMSILKTGSGMAWNAFLGDFIHDFIERKRDSKGGGSSSPSSTQERSDKVKPFLGLAALSHEEEYRFTRTFEKLDPSQQGHLAEFLLEYYIKPAQTGGLISRIASMWQYDNFMLLTVNRDSASKSLGAKKITEVITTDTPRTDRTANRSAFNNKQKVVNVDRTSTTGGTKTVTTTEETKEFFTPGGEESMAFLENLATYYRDGKMKAAEDYLRLNKMPTMDPEALQKVEEFIKRNYSRFIGWLETAFGFTKETILLYAPRVAEATLEYARNAPASLQEHNNNIKAKRPKGLGWLWAILGG